MTFTSTGRCAGQTARGSVPVDTDESVLICQPGRLELAVEFLRLSGPDRGLQGDLPREFGFSGPRGAIQPAASFGTNQLRPGRPNQHQESSFGDQGPTFTIDVEAFPGA